MSAKEAGFSELSRAYNLLSEALELDEAGEAEDALEQYKLAVDICLQTKKAITNKDVQEKLSKVAVQALDRAESLRTELDTSNPVQSSIPTHSELNVR